MEHIKERIFCLNLGEVVIHEIVSCIPPSLHLLLQTHMMATVIIHELLQRSVLLYGLEIFPIIRFFLPVLTVMFIVNMLLKTHILFKLFTERKYICVWDVHLMFQVQYVHLHLQCENDQYQ